MTTGFEGIEAAMTVERTTGSRAGTVTPIRQETSLSVRSTSGPRHRICGVLFDLCGVLYDGSLWYRWLHHLLTHMRLVVEFSTFVQGWEEQYLDLVHHGELKYWDAMRIYLRSLGVSDAQIDEVHAAGLAKRREFERTTRPFPGVRETLARLSHQQVSLGVVCSRSLTEHDMMNSLVALKLRQHFSLVTSRLNSEQSNMPRRQLTTSARRMGLHAHQVAYVGCHEVPLRAAIDCGMPTFAFNVDRDVKAHHRLEQFDQLLSSLDCPPPQLLAG